MAPDIPTQYDPAGAENAIYQRWLDKKAFAAIPDERDDRYVVMMPLPNVTGALHMGHAMDNVMQDLLIRWHRMRGDNTLWQPGTDHAGIATQAVVEKRLFEMEGKTRHDIGRKRLVERIWEWKDQYQARIIAQQQAMGCSCDWDRQRFTMDPVCTRAVREAFFRLFKDGLIYRGLRLVNWDCHLKTAVADDEVEHKSTAGHFWHLRYPVIDPGPGEPTHIVVATTRPETMLGDTAVAIHPDPAKALEKAAERTRERLQKSSDRDRPDLEAELEAIEERKKDLLPQLDALVRMAEEGRKIRLPLMDREIPLIRDEWAKPELGSGCVKITPAHDPNDYEVWSRHQDEIDIINILLPDGKMNDQTGKYANLDRSDARKQVVKDLEAQGLLESTEAREVELGISDRSKTPIEPYLSRQWFVRMSDVEGGVTFGRNTDYSFKGPGLAQAAIDAVEGDWKSASGRKLTFHPDANRYSSSYVNWLKEKRDWCISRQLWWGHRIPIWSTTVKASELSKTIAALPTVDGNDCWIRIADQDGNQITNDAAEQIVSEDPTLGPFEIMACPRNEEVQSKYQPDLEAAGLIQEEDVLDTWFSSALWPFSTLGWPDAENAPVEEGQTPLAEGGDSENYYYPGSCLITGRDIVTLWVARMVILGLYCKGDLPFTDCFIHANILDGKGERMSKSKGNGIDPVDIIESYGTDAMRYVLADMQTGTQDIRLPVQAISPFTGNPIELAKAKHGRTIFTYICPESGEEFDVLGTIPELPQARLVSDRFEVGRNFCNKLWNAARFALLNLEKQGFESLSETDLEPEDRWILSRLGRGIDEVSQALGTYDPSRGISAARDFFWGEYCDWYLELVKPRLKEEETRARTGQILALVLDQSLRLFQPFIPFITEALWEKLCQLAPQRGLRETLPSSELLCQAPWPDSAAFTRDTHLEEKFAGIQNVIRAIRDLRARYGVSPQQELPCTIRAAGDSRADLIEFETHLTSLARLAKLEIGSDVEKPSLAATSVVGDIEVYVEGLVDPDKERDRLNKQQTNLEGQVTGLEKKLSNENFVTRAPADVVETEKRRLREFQEELVRIRENLREL